MRKASNITRLRWKGELETPKDRAADSRVRFCCHDTEPDFLTKLLTIKIT